MKFEIPFPCSEDIDQMNPIGSGRFCGACDKVIIDFTKMSLPEIKSYFLNHKDEKTCGIFNQETIIAQEYSIPLEIIQQNYNRWKNLFILAFAVAFGFLSFGCGEEKKGELSQPTISTQETERGKVGMLFEKYDSKLEDKTKIINYTLGVNITPIDSEEINSLTSGIIDSVLPDGNLTGEVVQLEDSTNVDTSHKEILMGKVISNPAIIKKPNIKGRIIGDTILNQPILDSSKKCNQKNVVTVKAKKLSNRQPPIIDIPKFITGVPKLN